MINNNNNLLFTPSTIPLWAINLWMYASWLVFFLLLVVVFPLKIKGFYFLVIGEILLNSRVLWLLHVHLCLGVRAYFFFALVNNICTMFAQTIAV